MEGEGGVSEGRGRVVAGGVEEARQGGGGQPGQQGRQERQLQQPHGDHMFPGVYSVRIFIVGSRYCGYTVFSTYVYRPEAVFLDVSMVCHDPQTGI